MTPMYDFVQGFKTKVTYIMKLNAVSITYENIESELISGEMSPNLYDDLKISTEGVSDRCYQSFTEFIMLNRFIFCSR